MTALATACRRCGRSHEPDRAAIVAGKWRLCPDCRADAEPDPGPTDPLATDRPCREEGDGA